MRIWFLSLLLTLSLSVSGFVHADSARHVVVVLGEDVPVQREVATRFEALLGSAFQNNVLVEVVGIEAAQARVGQAGVELVVTVGTSAAQAVRGVSSVGSVLHVLLARSTYDALYGAEKTSPTSRKVAAIVLDQPWDRQLQLVKLLVPSAHQLSAVIGASSQAGGAALALAATRRGLVLRAVPFSEHDDFGDTLSEALAATDVLCALPDSQVLSPANAKWLLYGAFQKRIPVIGFSRAYVTAGALGAVYSTPEHIAKQAAEWVTQVWRGDGSLVGAVPPKYFSVAVNSSVAHALGLAAPSEDELTKLLGGRAEADLK